LTDETDWRCPEHGRLIYCDGKGSYVNWHRLFDECKSVLIRDPDKQRLSKGSRMARSFGKACPKCNGFLWKVRVYGSIDCYDAIKITCFRDDCGYFEFMPVGTVTIETKQRPSEEEAA
jgi:hypothetical protein